MAEMYMRNIRDWREATLMLSFEEKGYFDELLNLIYMYDDLLVDDDDFVCRAMPVHRKTHLRLKQILLKAELIAIKDGYYFNKRAGEEINKINILSEKNRSKASSRWAKSSKNKQKSNAEAFAVHEPDKKTADAAAMLKVNSESENESENKSEVFNNKINKRCKNAIRSKKKTHANNKTRKCPIDTVLDPDGEIPEQYLDYAKEQGLFDPKRTFLDWANWWVSENGRKAGKRGWLQTWKARVRKDVDRQMAGNRSHKGRGGNSDCTTTAGARLALDRRRNRR